MICEAHLIYTEVNEGNGCQVLGTIATIARILCMQIRLSADLDVAFRGFPIGWTAWMQVNVTGDNAWTSNN